MVKKITLGRVEITFTNRVLYTFLSLVILVLAGVAVWAAATPGVSHDINEIDACADTQILKMSGTSWICGTDDVGGDDARMTTFIGADCATDKKLLGVDTSGNIVCGTDDVGVTPKLQCPPRKVMVYEPGGEEWDEHLRYTSCTRSTDSVTLSDPWFCNGADCAWLHSGYCPQFCQEFGFTGSSWGIGGPNALTKWGYRSTATDWTFWTPGYYINGASDCICLP